MKRIKKMLVILFAVILLFACSSCLRPVSLEDLGYVISLGVDMGTEGGYYFTLMLQRASSGQSGESEGGAIVLAAEGDNIYDAVNTIESNYPAIINFARTDFIIFGRAAAESGAIEHILDFPLDSLRVRSSAIVFIADNTASEFIGGLSSNNEDNVSALQSALLNDKERTGMAMASTVGSLFEACYEGCFDYCAALGTYDPEILTDMSQKKEENEGNDPIADANYGDRIGGLKSYVKGSAVFDGWRMKAELDRRETMLLNIANGDFSEGTYTYIGKTGESITLLLEKKQSTMILVNSSNGTGEFMLNIELYAAALNGGNSDPEAYNNAVLDARNQLRNELEELFQKCRSAGSDAFRLGTVFLRSCNTAEEWEKLDWKSIYPNSQLRISVDLYPVNALSTAGGAK